MTEHKETLGEKLLKLWTSILTALGLCTIKSRDLAIKELNSAIDEYNKTFTEYDEMIKDLKERSEKAKEAYDRVHDQAIRYRDVVPTENLEIIKELQKQIHDIYATSRDFSFPNSIAIPGSTAMNDCGILNNNEPFIDLKVRLIATDDETARINQEPDQKRRYAMMINIMKQRGVLERIAERMVSCGAVPLAISYNSDCTNFELFAEFTAKVLPNAGTIRTINNDVKEG